MASPADRLSLAMYAGHFAAGLVLKARLGPIEILGSLSRKLSRMLRSPFVRLGDRDMDEGPDIELNVPQPDAPDMPDVEVPDVDIDTDTR